MITAIIFWLAIFLLFHTYLFYPLILNILSGFSRPERPKYSEGEELPLVSVIIAAFNEETHIGPKIESIYRNSYSADKFEVLIGSDASDDMTAVIVKSYQDKIPNLRFFDFRERRGKGNVVNDLVREAKGEIILFTDANVMFDERTLFNLVKHFKDPRIGLVDSNMINMGMKAEGISFQEKAYISREVRIKNREGRLWGAMMGPFGGCYAIRRDDYTKVPSNFLVDDFYINMKIFEKGKLAINDIDAKVFEDLPDNLNVEFRRKVRIGTGNFQNLREFWKLLFRVPYGFAFLSHKVIRWFGPFLLIIALVSNILLALRYNYYLLILACHLLIYIIPLLDLLLKKINIHIRLFRLITHFLSMNAALFVGFFRSMKKVRSGVWERTSRG